MIVYCEDMKFAYFNGLKFTRDDKTGYYLNSTHKKRLHRAVWEHYYGEIPQDMEIHHKDGNKANNSINNLVLLSSLIHRKIHSEMLTQEQRECRRENMNKNARPAAVMWHKSSKGKEWHKKHYEKTKNKMHTARQYVCECCGKTFTSPQTTSRFCSNACKSAWRRNSGIDNIKKVCEYCGKEYNTNKYKAQRFCSAKCRGLAKQKTLCKSKSC